MFAMLAQGASWSDWLGAGASAATAVGVFLGCYQIWLSKIQARVNFEDEFSREYRQLAKEIPVQALLGQELTNEEHEKYLGHFYHYIDLSNEQVFLRQQKRISAETWSDWCEGMKTNFSLPAFKRAWNEIKDKPELGQNFMGLRELEECNFEQDPASSPDSRCNCWLSRAWRWATSKL